MTHIRSEQIIDKEFKTKGGKLDVKILPGHQSELINNIHVVTTSEGFTFAQTGDQYNEEDLTWLLGCENKNSCIGCFVDQLLGESFLRYD